MYKRIFLSKVTAAVAFVCIVLLCAGSFLTGRRTDRLSCYDLFDMGLKLLLSLFLFVAYCRHSLNAMQAGCSGLMLCMLCHQGRFVLDQLLSQSMDSFIILGFWGSFFLAGEWMLLVLEALIAVNYLLLSILKKRSLVRITVNQTGIVLLFFFLALQLFVNTRLHLTGANLWYFALSHLCIVAVYLLVACAELIVTLDWVEVGQ